MEFEQPPLVIHVIHHLVIGGMENGLVNIINNSPVSRYRHMVLCIEDFSDFRNRITRTDVDVVALHRSKVGVWKVRQEIFRICRKLKPMIVHSRNQSGLDAIIPARLAGVPYCIHGEHGWDVDNLDGKRFKPALLRRLHAPFVSRYITVSKNLQKYLEERIGVSADKISQIYNGVDTKQFCSPIHNENERADIRRFIGSKICIGSVGRLQAVKNHALLLTAIEKAIDKKPYLREKVSLLIVGDGPLRGELESLAKTLGVLDITKFVGSTDDVPSYLRCMNIFVLPSLSEGISNTILEAMSSALPVIATAVGGNPELIDDGFNGVLVPAKDHIKMSEAIISLMEDEYKRISMGSSGLMKVSLNFSWSSAIEAYLSVYDELLGAV